MKELIKRIIYRYPKVSGAIIGRKCSFISRSNFSIGRGSVLGPENIFYNLLASVKIGRYVMTGPQVMFITGNHRVDCVGIPMILINEKQEDDDQPIVIEDDVWIGARAIILKGVTIGTGSIVAAGAIVTKDIPPYSIYYGVGKIKSRFTEEEIIIHEKEIKKYY